MCMFSFGYWAIIFYDLMLWLIFMWLRFAVIVSIVYFCFQFSLLIFPNLFISLLSLQYSSCSSTPPPTTPHSPGCPPPSPLPLTSHIFRPYPVYSFSLFVCLFLCYMLSSCFCLSLFPSLSFSVSVCLYVCVCLSVCLSAFLVTIILSLWLSFSFSLLACSW